MDLKLIKPVCQKLNCHILILGRNKEGKDVFYMYFSSNKDAKTKKRERKTTLIEHEVLSI